MINVKIFHKLSPIIVSTHKILKITEENGNVNSHLSFEGCFLIPCVVVSTSARKWVTLGKFECLRGVDFVVGDVWEERGGLWKGNREERERKECLEGEFQFGKNWHWRERREKVMLRKLQWSLTCMFVNDAILFKSFPSNAQHDAVLGTTFPPKAQHNAVLGTKLPTLDKRWTGPLFFLF